MSRKIEWASETIRMRWFEQGTEIVGSLRGLPCSGSKADRKADGSFVTETDIRTEEWIRKRLEEKFPDHGIQGEELGGHGPDSEFRWIIDPIDGTHSFVLGIPLYGTLLALLYHNRPVMGWMLLPGIDTLYSGCEGLGAYKNGERLIPSSSPGLSVPDEVIAVGERRQFAAKGREDFFDRLMILHPHTRVYCDCFGHGLAIEGSAGAMVDCGLKIWDISAARILAEEAGCIFHSLKHERRDATEDVVFGKPAVVEWILEKVL